MLTPNPKNSFDSSINPAYAFLDSERNQKQSFEQLNLQSRGFDRSLFPHDIAECLSDFVYVDGEFEFDDHVHIPEQQTGAD